MKALMTGFVCLLLATTSWAAPLDSTITYQGELDFQGSPANGVFDFQFELFDADNGGALIGTVVLDDVAVDSGLFSVQLDFGPGAFNGEQRWIELAVRDGASGGGYTGLLPRQQLTAAPYALHAQAVAENAVTNLEILDGTIGAAELANGSVGSAEIIDGSVGSADLASGSVGTAQILDGSVGSADLASGSVGTAQILDGSVGSADLASGSVGTAQILDGSVGSADLASGSVGSPQILDGSIGSADLGAGSVGGAQINPAEVQARVSGVCPVGQAMRAVDPSGQVTCAPLPLGDIQGITTAPGSGLTGGCTAGTCSLAVNNTEVQRRVTGACGPTQAIGSIGANGSVGCVNLPQAAGDIEGITTTDNSGLNGGCLSGTCSLSVDPTDFNSDNPVDSGAAKLPVLSPKSSTKWTELTSFNISSGTQAGEVMLVGNAFVKCDGCDAPELRIFCEMAFNSGTDAPLNAIASTARVGRQNGVGLTDSIGNTRTFAQGKNLVQTYVLWGRATSTDASCSFEAINATGIFQPN